MSQNDELIEIITRFAECGWEVIDTPSKDWLNANKDGAPSETVTADLVAAVQKADIECGSCGCEFDPLYKRALVLLSA